MSNRDETEWGILSWALKRVLFFARLSAVSLPLCGILVFAVGRFVAMFDFPMERRVVQEFEDPRGRFRAVVVHGTTSLDETTEIAIGSCVDPGERKSRLFYDAHLNVIFTLAEDGELQIRVPSWNNDEIKTATIEIGSESLRVSFTSPDRFRR